MGPGDVADNRPDVEGCEKHEWPIGMDRPCPDCVELSALNGKVTALELQIRDMERQERETRAATEMSIADLRHAIETRERNAGELTFQLKDSNRLNGELLEEIRELHKTTSARQPCTCDRCATEKRVVPVQYCNHGWANDPDFRCSYCKRPTMTSKQWDEIHKAK